MIWPSGCMSLITCLPKKPIASIKLRQKPTTLSCSTVHIVHLSKNTGRDLRKRRSTTKMRIILLYAGSYEYNVEVRKSKEYRIKQEDIPWRRNHSAHIPLVKAIFIEKKMNAPWMQ